MGKTAIIKKEPKFLIFIIGLITALNSCCPFVKEESLGSNLYLSEYDNVDRRIFYANESCSGSGIEIIPMTVLEYNYDSKWVIAKSGTERDNSNFQYWIIKNDVDTNPTLEQVKSNTIGPLDWEQFSKELTDRKIRLKLKMVQ